MFERDQHLDDIKRDSLVESLYEDLTSVIFDNDLEKFKELIISPTYSSVLTKDEIEQYVFDCTYVNIGDEEADIGMFFNYLIFDYNISEKNAFEYVRSYSYNKENISYVEKLFRARDLKKDLIVELDNKEIQSKQLKL